MVIVPSLSISIVPPVIVPVFVKEVTVVPECSQTPSSPPVIVPALESVGTAGAAICAPFLLVPVIVPPLLFVNSKDKVARVPV